MKRRIGIGLIVISLAFCGFVPSSGFAASQSELKKIQQDKQKQKEEAEKVLDLLEEKKKEIEKIEEKMGPLDAQIAKLNQEKQQNEKALNEQFKRFKTIIERVYLSGEMEYTVKLLEARSFSEFLARFEVVRLLVKRDASILQSFMKTKKKYEDNIKALNQKKAELAPLLEEEKKAVEELQKAYAKHKKTIEELEKKELGALGFVSYGNGILGFPSTPGYVSWNFGQDRGSHFHAGIDIPRPPGTPIYAAEDGTVTLIKSDPGGYGYYIDISHGNGLTTRYAHMYRYTISVYEGQRVRRGQRIAGVGNAGRSYGARGGYHLHFEVHKNGRPVNPRPYL
ncbi:murein hydrolase activator EnvC family protein [Lihuaxuella thermophila]|uniref:Murein DD-endopeptidase MepM and murein hydrolase activator NlpD, contain LysM domain n=1 Tax=Lihuaxuella thermophila TaxID=1173111 RepID=A0A1H8G935_9BACL|nr:M23 family metallopeptidase [Lihuaxuella thermophila]SEN40280.1 Murein DD-endopeptidase MepM and murein hydrolase activator NlpD, contain LysM domain [Lihuaxuella thermophila]